MESIDVFGSYDDSQMCNFVTLKDGIDLRSLARDNEVEFEVDDSAAPSFVDDDRPFSREEVFKNTSYKCAATENDLSPFEQLRTVMQDISGDGGVLKKLITQGVGSEVPEGALVRVHYNGYLEYSDEPYDSSKLRNRQQQFRLGEGEVLPGWEFAVKSMRKSEKAEFLLSPEYAFGSMGCPPRIPPDASILFEIEVISFVDPKSGESIDELPSELRRGEVSFVDTLTKASSIKEDGNTYYQAGMYNDAARKYKKALSKLEDMKLKDEAEEDQWKAMILKLYLNMALCCHKQRKPKMVITFSKKALEIDSDNMKAHFRLGQAYMQLGEFRRSRDYLLKANRCDPGNKEVCQELQELDRAEKRFNAVQQSGTEGNTPPPLINPDENNEYFKQKLSDFKGNPKMPELVLPAPLKEDDITCVVKTAGSLGLETQMLSDHSLRVYKPEAIVPERFL